MNEAQRAAALRLVDFALKKAAAADTDISEEIALRAQLFARGAIFTPACWCERCDMQTNAGFRTRMSVCQQCGDKRCPRAEWHGNECSKTPNGPLQRPVLRSA